MPTDIALRLLQRLAEDRAAASFLSTPSRAGPGQRPDVVGPAAPPARLLDRLRAGEKVKKNDVLAYMQELIDREEADSDDSDED